MDKICKNCKHWEPLTEEQKAAYMKMFDGHCGLTYDLLYDDDSCERFIVLKND